MEWYGIVTILVLVIALIILWKKGIIGIKTVTDLGDAAETLAPFVTKGSLVDQLITYSIYAFHAAEQLMTKGEIAAEERKEKALALVAEFAIQDGITLDESAFATVDTLLEANCDIKGHTAYAFPLDMDLEITNWNHEQLVRFCDINSIDIEGLPTDDAIRDAIEASGADLTTIYRG